MCCHNPYFNRWFSAMAKNLEIASFEEVTILILIDGFLQFSASKDELEKLKGHNPYFNRWFSAMYISFIGSLYYSKVTILILIDGFLQYVISKTLSHSCKSHNPYFNRWFSAIKTLILLIYLG